MKNQRALCFFLLLLSINVAYGFEYRIELAVIEGKSVPGHETLTSRGVDCFNEAKGIFPTNCLQKTSSLGLLNDKTSIPIPSILDLNAQELLDASSFPDDPGRVAMTHLSGAKGFFLNEEKCLIRPWYQLGFGKKRRFFDNITGGLFCNSHYGVLQFWHAMASRPMPSEHAPVINDNEVEPYQVTLSKILGWAKFTYQISKDEDAKILRREFCPFFEELKKDNDMRAMALAFKPNPETDILPTKEQFHCEAENPPFRVRFVFKQQCDGLVSAKKCDPIDDNAKGNRRIQIAALGSLIHMVQDSYSQSHVVRGQYDQANPTRINCSPVKAYLTYQGQDKDKHAASDGFPISMSPECSTSKIDDPVTATARILWFVSQNSDNADNLIQYLKKSVFKPAYDDIGLAPNASPGKYFEPKEG